MNGTKVALGPLPVRIEVSLPAIINVPVALFAMEMVETTVSEGLAVMAAALVEVPVDASVVADAALVLDAIVL